MSKHTPGPLMICEGEEGWIVDTPHERPGADGALAYVAYHADAVLYAAAPELLEACKEVLERLQMDVALATSKPDRDLAQILVDKLQAAIAAAEGE